MNQIIKTIQREAADTSKGYTLQKLRTISLLLNELQHNKELDFVAAVEYNGDVFLENKHFSYTEENKAYESKNFSFASQPIRNTMVYFLDHWLNNGKDVKIKFGIYATNKSVKEEKRGMVKTLNINLPKKQIIQSLIEQDFSDKQTIIAVKSIILTEYKNQYENNRQVDIKTSHYETILKFDDDTWKDFFGKIVWTFNNEPLETLEAAIISQIKSATFIPSEQLLLKAPYIRAELFYQLEIRQSKTLLSDRFLTRDKVELIFHNAVANGINDNSYKYLKLDYSLIKEKIANFLVDFINNKYFALSGIRKAPGLLQRNVTFFDSSIRISKTQADNFLQIPPDNFKGSLASLVQFDKPTFLFGELGSGKSSLVANYVLTLIDKEPDILPIFIPAAYLQQRKIATLGDVKSAINDFVNIELQLIDPIFDIDVLFKTKKETILVVDGIDELSPKSARQLIAHLKSMKTGNDLLRLIATGRPVELEGAVPGGWNTLFTVSLTEIEIKKILYNEALNRDLPPEDANPDSESRLQFLKSRPELFSIANTPLIICAIRDSLTDSIVDKTLGDILYGALQKKLQWSDLDGKSDSGNEFYDAYPTGFSREHLLAKIAWQLLSAEKRSITEIALNGLLNNQIPASAAKPKIVSQAVSFFKNAFLQDTSGGSLGFISAPLLECAFGIELVEQLKSNRLNISFAEHWRSLSFALSICRQQGYDNSVEQSIKELMDSIIKWPRFAVTQFAVILAEFKNATLCEHYFNILERLEFRPIRLEANNDRLSSYSYAMCISQAGDIGFDWFYDNYIGLKQPLIHYEGKLCAGILADYLMIRNYKLESAKIIRLEKTIEPNLAIPNSFCFELLPVLTLVTQKGLSEDQYLQCLAGQLSDERLQIKVRELLIAKCEYSKKAVLRALETVCGIRDHSHPEAAELWFEISTKEKIDQKVLGALLNKVNPESFEELYAKLGRYIGKENLLAFFKYAVISESSISGHAARFLFLAGYRNFKVIGPALINSIDWLDRKNYEMVDMIKAFVQEQNPESIGLIVQNMPVKNHLGVPPAYWRVFLAALEHSDTHFEQDFLNAMEHLHLFTLTRYPEIRIAFINLFKTKITYKELVRKQLYRLDNKLRYSCAALLLTLYPESEFDAMDIVVSGMTRSSEMDEWETFCLGLNYSLDMLDNLSMRSKYFMGTPRIYALILLYRYNYPLNDQQKLDLMNGLMDEGYFLDKEGYGMQVKYHIILSKPEMLEEIVPFLDDKSKEKAQRAADIISSYHLSNLDPNLKCKVYLLSSQSYERRFYELTAELTEPEFLEIFSRDIAIETEKFIQRYGKPPLLGLFYQVITGKATFSTLFKEILLKHKSDLRDGMDLVYQWLIDILRLYPRLLQSVQDSISEALNIPIVAQGEKSIFLWLKLAENEFNPSESQKDKELQAIHPRSHTCEELFITLYLRGVYREDLQNIRLQKLEYVAVFASHKPSQLSKLGIDEVEKYLFDLEDIPREMAAVIENVLLFGTLSDEELIAMETKGNLANYFVTVVNFCRAKSVSVEQFSKSKEIGGFGFNKNEISEKYKKILFKIYRSLITEEDYLKRFIDGQKAILSDPDTTEYVQVFLQLLAVGHKFEDQDVFTMFEKLYNSPAELRPQTAYNLIIYLIEHIKDGNRMQFIENFYKYLHAFRNNFEKAGYAADYNLLLWILSLFLIYLEDKVTPETRTGFLLGTRYLFLETNSLQRHLLAKPDYFFSAGNLLNYTYPILEKINPKHIKEMTTYGMTVTIPEIRATCYVMNALAGGNYRDYEDIG